MTDVDSDPEPDHGAASDDLDAAYDAVVYDLDGTLVRLAVDWPAVEAALGDLLREKGVDPDQYDTWELLDAAEEVDTGEAAHEVVAEHERAGAREAVRLALADRVAGHRVPVGVCSLNCEAACRLALDREGLSEHVRSVVGRDSLGVGGPRKPDPEPLLAVVEALGVEPGRTVFVGDSESDAVAAERAGTAFRSVADLLE